MRRALHYCLFFFGFALILPLSGCGPARTEVKGQVTYNGKAIDKSDGTISFYGVDGIAVVAKIDASGNYLASGVCVGENQVAVCYPRPLPTKLTKRIPKPDRGPDVPVSQTDPSFLIPDSYATPETSGLKVDVKKGTVYDAKLIDQ